MLRFIFVIFSIFILYRRYCEAKFDFDVQSSLLNTKKECSRVIKPSLKLVFVVPHKFVDKKLFDTFMDFKENKRFTKIVQEWKTTFQSIEFGMVVDTYTVVPGRCEIFESIKDLSSYKTGLFSRGEPFALHSGSIKLSYHLYKMHACLPNVLGAPPIYSSSSVFSVIYVILVDKPPHITRYFVPQQPVYASNLTTKFLEHSAGFLYITTPQVFYDYATLLKEMPLNIKGIRQHNGNMPEEIMLGLYDMLCDYTDEIPPTSSSFYMLPVTRVQPIKEYGKMSANQFQLSLVIDEGDTLYPGSDQVIFDLRRKRVVDILVDTLKYRYPYANVTIMKSSPLQSRFKIIASGGIETLSESYSYDKNLDLELEPEIINKEDQCPLPTNKRAPFRTMGSYLHASRQYSEAPPLLSPKKIVKIIIAFAFEYPHHLSTRFTEKMFQQFAADRRIKNEYVIYLAEYKCNILNKFSEYDHDVIEYNSLTSLELMTKVVGKIEDRLDILSYAEQSSRNYRQAPIETWTLPNKYEKYNRLSFIFLKPRVSGARMSNFLVMFLNSLESTFKYLHSFLKGRGHYYVVEYSWNCQGGVIMCPGMSWLRKFSDAKNIDLTPAKKNSAHCTDVVRVLHECSKKISLEQTKTDLTFMIPFVDEEQYFFTSPKSNILGSDHNYCTGIQPRNDFHKSLENKNILLSAIKNFRVSDEFDARIQHLWPTSSQILKLKPHDSIAPLLFDILDYHKDSV